MKCTSPRTLIRTTCTAERPCNLCNQIVHIVGNGTGLEHTFDEDGESHWSTCPSPVADAFRQKHGIAKRKPKKAQLGLFPGNEYPD